MEIKMNYKELANLLYPDVKSSDYWESKYCDRKLPQGAEVTRFAPSPTGYLHIGNFFGCMIDKAIAKSSGGVFYFRLEDTDKKREVQGAGEIALNIMEKFGIVPDEGLMADGNQIGNYGPYIQSERTEIYKSYAKELVSKGLAFPCFCAKAENITEIEKRREEQLLEGDEIEEKDPCRDMTFEEVQERLNRGEQFAIALRSKGIKGQTIKVFDEVKGEREVPANCKDIILIKSNGIAVYAFAHAVDDHLMRTTLVVRGNEWFSSYPSHLEVFEALGFQKVRYIHSPLISKIDENGNKRKVSKRKDKEADMRYFLIDGYPTNSVVEYLMNIANSAFEPWRKANPFAPISDFAFQANKIGVSDPIFDINKLNDISKTIISKMTAEEVVDNWTRWANEYDPIIAEYIQKHHDYVIQLMGIERGNEKPRKDIAKWSEIASYYDYMLEIDEKWKEQTGFDQVILNTNNTTETIKNVLIKYAEMYDERDSKDDWFAKIKSLCDQVGFCSDMKLYKSNKEAYIGSVADVSGIIRIAITGRKNTPDLFQLMKLLGKDKVEKRLKFSK